MAEIRFIPDKDIPQVIEIYTQGLETGLATFNTEPPTPEAWDAGHLKVCRMGAYEGDTLVGWRALSPTSARDCYRGVCEASLYIRNGYKGRGLGTDLMKRLVEESEKQGIWTLYASIFTFNQASIKMCLKNGWRIVGEREKIAKDRFGVWQNTTIMERRSKTVGMD